MDRRAAFFLLAAALCFVLVPIADHEHRWVASGLGVVYVLLALASFLDARSKDRARPTRRDARSDQ
jgi:hypothetical protein